MLRRYFRTMGNCIGIQNRASRSSESSEENSNVNHNRPLKHRKPKWKSNIRLTEAQLLAKREEFWDTAPAFEGRKEIWDALRASVNALEGGDFQMAQVILDGANISLPTGTLMECYDELGARYQLPVYILSPPVNLIRKNGDKKDDEEGEGDLAWDEEDEDDDLSLSHIKTIKSKIKINKKHTTPNISNYKKKDFDLTGRQIQIRIRFPNGEDKKLTVNTNENFAAVKRSLARCYPSIDPHNIKFYFAGKQLNNKTTLSAAKIESNYTIQALHNPDITNITTTSINSIINDNNKKIKKNISFMSNNNNNNNLNDINDNNNDENINNYCATNYKSNETICNNDIHSENNNNSCIYNIIINNNNNNTERNIIFNYNNNTALLSNKSDNDNNNISIDNNHFYPNNFGKNINTFENTTNKKYSNNHTHNNILQNKDIYKDNKIENNLKGIFHTQSLIKNDFSYNVHFSSPLPPPPPPPSLQHCICSNGFEKN